jgi:hypothetical protein
MKMETDPVSEIFKFLDFRITDDGRVQNAVILRDLWSSSVSLWPSFRVAGLGSRFDYSAFQV